MPKPLHARSLILCIALTVLLGTAAQAGKINLQEPIRLPDGQPLKSIYFFGHWWDPWKSDDAALAKDLKRLKELGFNTICVDHEVSQAINRDWHWLDREYKLAGQEKIQILPWLQLQSVDRENLMKFANLSLKQAVNQDGQPVPDCCDFRDSEFRRALAHYITVYLDRYGNDPALLRVKDGKRERPVVALMVEVGWRDEKGMPLSFDEDTNAYFRKWMKASYHDLKHLNTKWGTDYKSFDEIDPCDKSIFDYACEDKQNMPVAVREHVTFRARLIGEALQSVAKEVRKKHKDVMLAAEIAYPFSLDSPDAAAYRWNNANDFRIIDFADIVFIRTAGNTSFGQVKKDQDLLILNGKKVVLGYRLFEGSSTDRGVVFALDCASSANGLGYYNWNETADSASAIYADPKRQECVRLMNSTYDMLYDSEKRHVTTATIESETPVAGGGASQEEKPVDEKPAEEKPATEKPAEEKPAEDASAEQPAPAQVPPAPVEVPK